MSKKEIGSEYSKAVQEAEEIVRNTFLNAHEAAHIVAGKPGSLFSAHGIWMGMKS